jgi:RNA 2',3'-cyclic 3'-phosphodiesterase
MPRVFAAIEIGAAARDRIAREQERLGVTMRGSALRWVKKEQLHITLVFLGQLSDQQTAQAVALMNAPLRHEPFRFELGGIGVFPPHGAPRALWIGIPSGAQHVVAVQALVQERLRGVGYALERRSFSPHLTVARWRESKSSDRPKNSTTTPPTLATVDVGSVTLFQSHVSSAGSTYVVLAEARLGP